LILQSGIKRLVYVIEYKDTSGLDFLKEAGIEIYSDKTKATIKAVNVQKAQGIATLESITKQLNTLKVEVDEKLIKDLIESKEVFLIPEDGVSNMAKLESFIVENYSPIRNTITNDVKIDEVIIDDHKLNSIYKTACNFVFTCDYIKAENRCRIMCMRKNATVHHP
jgi:hypothetical protein